MSNFIRSQRRLVRFESDCRSSDRTQCDELVRRTLRRSVALDPAIQCERVELQRLTRRRIASCGSDCERLFEILESGGTMREAANTMQITYHVARTTRDRIAQVLESVDA